MAHENYISRGSMHYFLFSHTPSTYSLFSNRLYEGVFLFPTAVSVSDCEAVAFVPQAVKHPGKRFVPERGLGLFLWGPMCCLSPTGGLGSSQTTLDA